MTLKIYGSVRSRAGRVMWCAREVGIPFEQVEVPFDKMKEPEFLAVNPNGKVPAIVDDGVTLFESLAITLYLAKRHGLGGLYPSKVEDEGRTWQWSLWTATELEAAMAPAVAFFFFQRGTQEKHDESVKRLLAALRILDAALMGRHWLVGDRFSVADLNVASAAAIAKAMKVDLSSVPNVAAWLERCLSRPAAAQS
jgi:glutathione S-transferase